MFDGLVDDAMSKLGLMTKKINILKSRCDEMIKITRDLHFSAEKVEELFKKDIEQRKNRFDDAHKQLENKM